MSVLICDTECYHGYWLVAFKRVDDGKVVTMELSDRAALDSERLEAIIRQNTIVSFNGTSYDMPMIWYAIRGATNVQLKTASDRIIVGNVKYWNVDEVIGFRVPFTSHVDLIEPQPNAWASLKTLNGRLHGKKMQDLPIEPQARLTHSDMDLLTAYCLNDLDATHLLYDALAEPRALRDALSEEYGINFRSKSDSQIGEAIIKKVVEIETGIRPEKPTVVPGHSFSYNPPEFLNFQNSQLRGIFDRIKATDFIVQYNGKVDLPKWLADTRIAIGGSEFAMGIGGLHSTESNRAVHADEDFAMYDVDVMGFYPQIIINSKMYPTAVGPAFCGIYAKIKYERDALKPKLKDPTIPKDQMAKIKAKVEGSKITGNGSFGKTSSPFSTLYAPHLLIYTTLTGQLSILMLIDRLVAAGMGVVSANTDGVVIRCPRAMTNGLDGDRFVGGTIKDVTERWETDTGFKLEAVEYQSLYNQSVNTYIAVKPDGKTKRKGTLSNPWKDNDIRGMLMKNPNAVVCSDAVVEFITKGTDIEDYIRAQTDVRSFVTVVNVKGGGTWRSEYLGKVVRYIWSIDGAEILYKDPHPTTGNYKKVSRTDGCRPVMELPDELPADIDYDRYVQEAREILMDIGFDRRPETVRPIRLFKWSAPAWFAIAV